MKRILVPTDFSLAAEQAFRYGWQLARSLDTALILYHVYDPERPAMVDLAFRKREFNRQMEKHLMEQLQRLRAKVQGLDDRIPVSMVIGHAPAVDNILGFAQANEVDLIVMGSHNPSNDRLLNWPHFGSVSAGVLEECSLPVLIIPESADWTEPAKIAIASNQVQPDPGACSVLTRIARHFESHLTVLHVQTEKQKVSSPQSPGKSYSDLDLSLAEILEWPELEYRTWLARDVAGSLVHPEEKLEYDILVTVKRDKNFLQWITRSGLTPKLLVRVEKPLLVLPQA